MNNGPTGIKTRYKPSVAACNVIKLPSFTSEETVSPGKIYTAFQTRCQHASRIFSLPLRHKIYFPGFVLAAVLH